MKRLRVWQHVLVLPLSLALFILAGMPGNVMAGLTASGVSISYGTVNIDRAADVQTIQRVLDSKGVVQRLTDMGVSVGKVRASMDRLPTEDLYQIAVSMEGTQAESGVVGFAVLLIVVLLVALVIYMANKVGAHE